MKLLDKKDHEAIFDYECEVWKGKKLIMCGRFIYLTNRKANSISVCCDTDARKKDVVEAMALIKDWSKQFKG